MARTPGRRRTCRAEIRAAAITRPSIPAWRMSRGYMTTDWAARATSPPTWQPVIRPWPLTPISCAQYALTACSAPARSDSWPTRRESASSSISAPASRWRITPRGRPGRRARHPGGLCGQRPDRARARPGAADQRPGGGDRRHRRRPAGRRPDLGAAAKTPDFSQPVAIMLMAIVHLIPWPSCT